MIDVITEFSPRSATTRSITASRGSFPIVLPISVNIIPSYFLRSGFNTDTSITPSPPFAPYHWFSQVVTVGSSMSFRIRSRVAGSFNRPSILSRPPSRTHNGRHASSPLDARLYGYWLAVTSRPRARAASMRWSTSDILPNCGLYAVFRCQISAGIFARSAIVNTSSSDSKILAPSERWCVK